MDAIMAADSGDTIMIDEGVWCGEKRTDIFLQDAAIDIRKNLKLIGRGSKEKVCGLSHHHHHLFILRV
jgi:hypothetical protein